MTKQFWSGIGVGAIFVSLITLVVDATGPLGVRLPVGDAPASGSVLTEKLDTLYQTLDGAYYDRNELDPAVMYDQALKGFVDGIGDPYTVYLTSEENEIFDQGMEGSQNFDGIGAVVSDAEEGVLIEAVLKGSPAFQAGLKPLDIIVQIDDELTKPLGLNEAVQSIRGPRDSIVTLTILRQGAETPLFDVDVTRGEISLPSAEVEIIQQDGQRLLLLTVSIFGDDTMRVIKNALRQAGVTSATDLDGVILDLRGNGGGYLPVAVEVASFFLPKNELVATAKYSIFEDEVFKSQGYTTLPDVPLVVLIDEMSASASEIVALALQERGDATLVGQQSFGKGSIQTVQENKDGSSLKLTIGRRYAPSGANIDEEGIMPDQIVELDLQRLQDDEYDTQVQAAIEVLVGEDS